MRASVDFLIRAMKRPHQRIYNAFDAKNKCAMRESPSSGTARLSVVGFSPPSAYSIGRTTKPKKFPANTLSLSI
jgi:hypothetical protein